MVETKSGGVLMTSVMQLETPEARFREASEHLRNELGHCFGSVLRADQPIIRAISAYGHACRLGADIHEASEHVYAALRFHLGACFDAHQPIIRALSEYGHACRELGPRR
jgi:hypothetical protein